MFHLLAKKKYLWIQVYHLYCKFEKRLYFYLSDWFRMVGSSGVREIPLREKCKYSTFRATIRRPRAVPREKRGTADNTPRNEIRPLFALVNLARSAFA